MLRALGKVHDTLTQWSFVAAAILLFVIFYVYCQEVLLRYILNSPTSWSSEVISYAQCVSAFLVMPLLTKLGSHVAITVVLERLKPRAAGILSWFLSLVSFVICAMGAWISLDETLRQYLEDVQLMKVHPIPQWWISIFIGYGLLMSAFHFLRQMNFRSLSAAYSARSAVS